MEGYWIGAGCWPAGLLGFGGQGGGLCVASSSPEPISVGIGSSHLDEEDSLLAVGNSSGLDMRCHSISVDNDSCSIPGIQLWLCSVCSRVSRIVCSVDSPHSDGGVPDDGLPVGDSACKSAP